jgi:hypothetical protein
VPAPVVTLKPTAAAPERAGGRALIVAGAQGLALQYQAAGLAPTRGPQRYVVWLYRDRNTALPLTVGQEVGADGVLAGELPIPGDIAKRLPGARYVDVSLQQQAQSRTSRAYRGVSVLRGAIPPGPQISPP